MRRHERRLPDSLINLEQAQRERFATPEPIQTTGKAIDLTSARSGLRERDTSVHLEVRRRVYCELVTNGMRRPLTDAERRAVHVAFDSDRSVEEIVGDIRLVARMDSDEDPTRLQAVPARGGIKDVQERPDSGPLPPKPERGYSGPLTYCTECGATDGYHREWCWRAER